MQFCEGHYLVHIPEKSIFIALNIQKRGKDKENGTHLLITEIVA